MPSFLSFFSSRKRQSTPSHSPSSQRSSLSSSLKVGCCSPSASGYALHATTQPPAAPVADGARASTPQTAASASPSPKDLDCADAERVSAAQSPCVSSPHAPTQPANESLFSSSPSATLGGEDGRREGRGPQPDEASLQAQPSSGMRSSRSAASFFSLLRSGKTSTAASLASHGRPALSALQSADKELHVKHLSSTSSSASRSRAHSHQLPAWIRESSPRPPAHPTPLCASLRNGVLFPILGLGTYRLHGEECMAVVERAVSLRQIMLIDTASVYRNEEEVGKALRDAGARGFPWQLYLRDDCEMNIRCRREASNLGVFLTSKISPKDVAGGRQRAYEAALMSMKRLGVEQLDLYLIHWPGVRGHKSSSRENRRLRHECWQALEQLYKEKKVRAIGVSNFLVRHLEDLLEDGVEVVPMVNQIEFQPLCFDRDLLKWGEKHGMRIQAYASLGSGDPRLLRNPTVLAIAVECGVTPALVLLRWAVQHGCHVIPCSRRETHLIEDTHVFDFCLNDEQMTLLDRLCDNTHFCWDPNIIA
ncbi:UNVERIFIED_CONTAM: aldose reductase, putative [Hammondia hammondi]|eukprot:XP_008882691.1 aldose reductase, putative [Hammondia hammondi]